jgi:predicted nucleic acid-binding protein
MTARFFLDTNVLIYAYDATNTGKQARAKELLAALAGTQAAAVSTQVLAEMFYTLTRKFASLISPDEAVAQLFHHVQTWQVIDVSTIIVMEAAQAVTRHKLSFWDAQIWAAAKLNDIPIILSEDFNTGSSLQGVRFVNPFAGGFRIDRLPT